MNSYAVAFGILGSGIAVAAILWSIPLLRRRQVRSFRKALAHVDVVAMAWTQSLRHHRSVDDPDRFTPGHRSSRHRHDEPGAGGAPLV